MQRFLVREPGEGDVVIGEPARDQDRNLVVLGPVEVPLVDRRQTLDDVDRMFGPIVGAAFDERSSEVLRQGDERGEKTARPFKPAARRNLADS